MAFYGRRTQRPWGQDLPDPEQVFHRIGTSLPQAAASQMFGKKCYKIEGKAFICFFQDGMVFKLAGEDHARAIGLAGARLFDPSGKGRPMKEWVQLPFDTHPEWDAFAQSSLGYCTLT